MSKYEALKAMRVREPELWCILTGSKKLHMIAVRLYMTPKELRAGVNSLIDQGVIVEYKGNYELDTTFPGYEGLTELQTFAKGLRTRIMDSKDAAAEPPANQTDLLAFLVEEPRTVKHLIKLRGGMGKPAYVRTVLRSLTARGWAYREGGKWGITQEGIEVRGNK